MVRPPQQPSSEVVSYFIDPEKNFFGVRMIMDLGLEILFENDRIKIPSGIKMSKVSYLKTQLPSGPTIKLSADVIRRTADPNKPIQSVDDIELDALRVTVEDDSFEFKGAYDRRKRGKRTNFPGFDAEILELMRELRDYPEGVNLEEVEAHAEVVQIEQFFEQ